MLTPKPPDSKKPGKSKSKLKPDYNKLRATLMRTGEWAVMPASMSQMPTRLLDVLDWQAGDINRVGAGYRALAARLPYEALTTQQRQIAGRDSLPAQEPWIRSTALSLGELPWVQEQSGVPAARLGDLVNQDAILRAIRVSAGRAKDGAMDGRLLVGSFGWHLLCTVLAELRQRVAAEPDRQKSEALLNDFSPMLVIIGEIEDERRQGNQEQASARKDLKTELGTAQAEARRAEDLHAYHSGQQLSRDQLLDLAKNSPDTRGNPR